MEWRSTKHGNRPEGFECNSKCISVEFDPILNISQLSQTPNKVYLAHQLQAGPQLTQLETVRHLFLICICRPYIYFSLHYRPMH